MNKLSIAAVKTAKYYGGTSYNISPSKGGTFDLTLHTVDTEYPVPVERVLVYTLPVEDRSFVEKELADHWLVLSYL